MRKLTVHERKTLKGIAYQIINLATKGKEMDLSPKEQKLLRKLAFMFDMDNLSFVNEWIEAFPDMTKEEAIYTMYHTFQGVNKNIEGTWKEHMKGRI